MPIFYACRLLVSLIAFSLHLIILVSIFALPFSNVNILIQILFYFLKFIFKFLFLLRVIIPYHFKKIIIMI